MRKTIFIHAGFGKTGTSHLQSFFSMNREQLLKDGVLYPETGLQALKHTGLCQAILNNDDALIKAFYDEIEDSNASHVVVSAEDFPARLAPFIDKFKDHYDYKVILFVRRHDQWIESRYRQAIKGKEAAVSQTIEEWMQGKNFSWLPRINAFAKLLGQENIVVSPFERQQMPSGLCAHFMDILGVTKNGAYVEPDRTVNKSPSSNILEFIRTVNQAHTLPEDRAGMLRALADMTGAGVFPDQGEDVQYLSPQARLELLDAFASETEEIARRFLGREDGRLFYDDLPTQRDESPGPELDISTLAQVSGLLWMESDRTTSLALKEHEKTIKKQQALLDDLQARVRQLQTKVRDHQKTISGLLDFTAKLKSPKAIMKKILSLLVSPFRRSR